jgi:hypothetical protein
VLSASRKACSKKRLGEEKKKPKINLTFYVGFYTTHNPLSGGSGLVDQPFHARQDGQEAGIL